jgi:peptidyl-prolyl cis-trans isomerase A (cyclophilin A)
VGFASLTATTTLQVPDRAGPEAPGSVAASPVGTVDADPTAVGSYPSYVRIETELGNIEIEVSTDQAPVTAANFLKYVEAGLYTGGRFHRTVHDGNQPDNEFLIDVIQGGINSERRGEVGAPIALERTRDTGLKHLTGSISIARGGPDSATSDFFICVEDEPELDFGGKRNADGQGFAAFGTVIAGMDVVRAIQMRPAEGQSLAPPIQILRIILID